MSHLNGCKYLESSHEHKKKTTEQSLVTQTSRQNSRNGAGGEWCNSSYLMCESQGRPKRVHNCCILDEEKVAVPGINVTTIYSDCSRQERGYCQ